MQKQEIIQNIFQNMGAMGRIMAGKSMEPHPKGMPTHAQVGVLFVISSKGSQSIKDLAACFGMTSSAATQLVNALVKDGLLTRREDKVDRRKIHLELTAKGKQNMANVKKQRYDMMSKILEILNPRELLQLKNIQEKITERVKLLWTKNQVK